MITPKTKYHGNGATGVTWSGILRAWKVLQIALAISCVFLNSAVAHEVRPSTDPDWREQLDRLLDVIRQKLVFYNETYPEIRFVHVGGGKDWHEDMVAVITMLGSDADALDYQHPPNIREAVLSATMERLRNYLEADVVSGSLYRVGVDSPVDRANLCVITLNPRAFVANDYDATRYMLDLPEETMKKVHPARYLDHIHQLEFALDHEAFHCLDTYFNGGVPRSFRPLESEYHVFRRESISDAYAMAMHIKTHGRITPYAQNIVLARALWIFSDSPNRCTFETIRELLRFDPVLLRPTPVRELIRLATHIRDKTVSTYESYLVQRAAELEAAAQLGVDTTLFGEKWALLGDVEISPALVQFLVNRYQYYFALLFNDHYVELEAPPASWLRKPDD